MHFSKIFMVILIGNLEFTFEPSLVLKKKLTFMVSFTVAILFLSCNCTQYFDKKDALDL
jgi:hypothetical protein